MRQDSTILVLDDDPQYAHTLAEVLEVKGYQAIEVHKGKLALHLIRHEPIAVALVDYKLDDVPGIEVMREIKRKSPTTECILLTGYTSQEIVIEAINEGAFGFLQKPCDPEQLLVLIRRALEKRDASEALRETERHTRAILHSSLDAVVTIDEMGYVVDWNPRAEVTLGWQRREALGRELWSLIFSSEDEALKHAWGAPGEVSLLNRPVEAKIRHKDGRLLMVEWAVTMVEVAGRRTFTFFIKDLTARKRLEEQFLQAQKTETVNLLAGGVLHDFNNVLTAVMGQSALLKQDPMLGPEHRQIAQDVLDAAQRASVLARQLLAYSRPQVRNPEVLDLNAVIIDLSRLLKRVLGENIVLERDLAKGLPPVSFDRSEIEQVLMNLVLNSRDAMPEGGTIRIETRLAGDDCPPLPGRETGQQLELVVKDAGCGMEKTTLIRAFEPFFTTKDVGRGVGLGLFTVKSIVEENGGRIGLESEPDKGTTCRICLPASEPQASSPAVAKARKAEALGGSETVLLAEDEAMVRAMVIRALTRYGYEVLEASGGPEALKLADQHGGPIALLITDVIMPQMNGRELAEKMKERHPDVKTLFISGYSDDVTIRRGMLSGDVELLPKPFSPQQLLQKVRELLDVPGDED